MCITALAVAQNVRGKGIGKELLNHVIQSAIKEGCKSIVVETIDARDYYIKHGFEPVESIEDGGFIASVLTRNIETT